MDLDDVSSKQKARAARRKIFEVNTKKPSAAKDLEKYLNPANQFEEMMSPRARRGIPSVYRYFFYKPDPANGPPKGMFETIVQSISSIVAPVQAPAPQNSNGPANVPDSNVDEILHKMRHVGVDSQNQFDEMVEMVESKLSISGGAQKKKSLKRRLKRFRKDRGRTHKK
jgi:hypothetical protein